MTLAYRIYDVAGRLLYAGHTKKKLTQRLGQHRCQSPWYFQEAFRIEYEWHDHSSALRLERYTIRNYDPKYNICGTKANSIAWVERFRVRRLNAEKQ